MKALSSKQLTISPNLLLGVYASIPFVVLMVLIDRLLLGSALQSRLNIDPESYPLFTLVFTLPHIISSYFGFFEKEYINAYGRRLLRGAQFVVLGSLALSFINIELTFYAFALFTMYHVFKQQSGIARTLMKGPGGNYRLWEWLGVGLSFAVYLVVYTNVGDPAVYVAFTVPFLLYIYFGIRIAATSNTGTGRLYFLLTLSIPPVGLLLFATGYPLLAIAMPRLIHDVTAYMFYVSHDQNRYVDTRKNYLYSLTGRLHIPVFIANPLISIGLALLLESQFAFSGSLAIMMLFLFHYYFEGFVWKRDSLHRQYIHVG